MKKAYFNDLQKTFKNFNPYLNILGEIEFDELLKKVESTNKPIKELLMDMLLSNNSSDIQDT